MYGKLYTRGLLCAGLAIQRRRSGNPRTLAATLLGRLMTYRRVDASLLGHFKINNNYCRLIALTRGLYAIIWEPDFEWAQSFKWQAYWNKNTRSYYAATRCALLDGRIFHIRLHRAILGLDKHDPRQGDHINRNTLDCRRDNLRIATVAQNSQNRPSTIGSKSKYKGVYWSSRKHKWISAMRLNKATKYLGSYLLEEDAARKYDEAALRAYGEFAYLNFPEEHRLAS